MIITRQAKKIFLLFFAACSNLLAGISYDVEYLGLSDSAALKTIISTTQLNTLKKVVPDSINAVRYRAESDIPKILAILRSYGYYEAIVELQVEEGRDDALVIININPGPCYKIQSFDIKLFHKHKELLTECPEISAKSVGITVGRAMNAKRVIHSEKKILSILAECGYPLARVESKEIIADGETKTVKISIDVDTGPLCKFGELEIKGNCFVKDIFIQNKLEWKRGDIYRNSVVEETQRVLVDSGLFSAVIITPSQQLQQQELPIIIELAESKHHSINAGISYQTYYGPGLTFGWEDRNIGGVGQKLSLQADVTQRSHTGLATYICPNFKRVHQDYVWQAQAMHENIIPYSERTYNLINRLERRVGKKIRMSIGGKIERLFVTASAQNGNYYLVEAPIYFAWNGSNSLLNPTEGLFFEYSGSPNLILNKQKNGYFSSVFAFGQYFPVTKKHHLVLAHKLTLGSILSKNEKVVPLSKRFYGGSEEDLRGYAYQSVSPLKDHYKPYGGRSEVFYTVETRLRVSKSIGLVPFFDTGNVYTSMIPTLKGKWLKSVGLGLRYFSFMGPFRVDIGFPLNKRKELDNTFRILVSIGQTF
jgi:translocation and assembly module TamA